jgi:hypothetical protein
MEQVVIIDPAEANDRTWSALARTHRTQEFSARVFVVEADGPTLDALRALPGVKTPAQIDPATASSLSRAEALSLQAWSARAAAPQKARPGDGLSWGHKDYQAP